MTENPSSRDEGEAAAEWRDAIALLVRDAMPGGEVLELRDLAPDADPAGSTAKGFGYGHPVRIRVRTADGAVETLVLHTAKPDPFGHDRPSDRARDMLLSHATFDRIPRHVRALDVGAVTDTGALVSLRRARDFYLLSSYGEGEVYAADLRRVAEAKRASEGDVARARMLAAYLAELHAQRCPDELHYGRSVRDLVGSGEGIYGIVDGYPEHTPAAPRGRLSAIEQACATYRWRLRDEWQRSARIHGDFHPFNVVFDAKGAMTLLDASRGCEGDPADDVTCMAINYPFFALGAPGSWRDGFGPLWRAFWDEYLGRTGDDRVRSVAPPYFAWRALVVANPVFYPALATGARDALLSLVERTLGRGELVLSDAEDLFR